MLYNSIQNKLRLLHTSQKAHLHHFYKDLLQVDPGSGQVLSIQTLARDQYWGEGERKDYFVSFKLRMVITAMHYIAVGYGSNGGGS